MAEVGAVEVEVEEDEDEDEDEDAVVSAALHFTPTPTALSEEVADSIMPSGRANLIHTMWSTATTAIPFDPDGWP